MKVLATQRRPDGTREKGPMDMLEEPPAPTGRQFKTKTRFSGLTNGSERNDLIRGNYAHADEALPAPWGYQNVGEVVAVGPDCKKVAVGDLVYLSCDHVEWNLVADDFLFCKLPPEVDPKEAALFGMTSVAVRTCRHADIRIGDRVLVVGAGIIGQTAAQVANVMGARVTICDVDEKRLDMARSIAAAETVLNTSGEGWAQHIPDFGFEVIIDVAGVPGMEDKLVVAAAPRGRVMFIAGRDKVTYTFNMGQGHEINIRQNSHFDNSDLANLCRLVARGQVKIAPFLKDVVPVDEAKQVYDTLRDKPNELLGTVFVW
jgi:2-desacetyl-2-hydroxyethyl bacteriochlorophyllide A dehydrogenase